MDPITGAALIGGGAALGLGGLDILGGLFGNTANAEENHKNRKLAMLMAKKQMQWRVNDLRNAGLNPVLAANSGLSSAGGHVPSSIPMQNPASSASSIGHSLLSLTSDYTKAQQAQKKLDSTVKLEDAQTSKLRAEELNTMVDAATGLKKLANYDEKYLTDLRLMEARIANLNANSAGEQARTGNLEALTDLYRQEFDYNKEMNHYNLVGKERELESLNLGNLLLRQKISHEDAYMGLMKEHFYLGRAKDMADIKRIQEETRLLYQKVTGSSLDNDAKKHEAGARFSPENEKLFRGAERIINMTSRIMDSASSVMSFGGAFANSARSFQNALRNSLRRRETPSLGKSPGKFGSRGVTQSRFNNDEQVSNYRSY